MDTQLVIIIILLIIIALLIIGFLGFIIGAGIFVRKKVQDFTSKFKGLLEPLEKLSNMLGTTILNLPQEIRNKILSGLPTELPEVLSKQFPAQLNAEIGNVQGHVGNVTENLSKTAGALEDNLKQEVGKVGAIGKDVSKGLEKTLEQTGIKNLGDESSNLLETAPKELNKLASGPGDVLLNLGVEARSGEPEPSKERKNLKQFIPFKLFK